MQLHNIKKNEKQLNDTIRNFDKMSAEEQDKLLDRVGSNKPPNLNQDSSTSFRNKQRTQMKKILDHINSGKSLSDLKLTKDMRKSLATVYLMTPEDSEARKGWEEIKDTSRQHSKDVAKYCDEKNISYIVISANIEYDLSMMSYEEKKEYFELYNLKESGIDRVAKHGYDILNLGTFFTSGPTETRAWTIKKKALAPEAAGKIHTDFQKGFIRAEVIAFDDYVGLKGSVNAKNEGKMRLEGKEYQVVEGDIVVFRYNV